MSKAILVMDMPNACEFCPMFIYEKCTCQKLDEYLGNDEADLTIERSSKCPLKEMPNKIPQFFQNKKCFSDKEKGRFQGWNDCLDEIIGEDDE